MGKVIDMSHVIIPGKSDRKFILETIGADEVNPNVVRLPNQWYIMNNIQMVSHIGTHIEAPFHIRKDGLDLARLPLEKFWGEAVILDLRNLPPRQEISSDQVADAARRAGRIHRGDIVLGNLGFSRFYGTPEYQQNPFFSTKAIQWLIQEGMKMMGVDASGVEIPGSESHVNHHALFEREIPLIENLTGFDQITKTRVQLYAFPIAVEGLESFPVRVVAFEPD
ncbi:MAG: cyclase family protein [Deltaproteobacteria bacterium]|nr:cyclase family protein [Deltaproteobacteria bacterium]